PASAPSARTSLNLTPGSRPARSSSSTSQTSFSHHAGEAARHESSDVGENARNRQSSWRREISWFPLGVELLLVLAQTAKVIEVLAVAIHHAANALPGGGERAALEAG